MKLKTIIIYLACSYSAYGSWGFAQFNNTPGESGNFSATSTADTTVDNRQWEVPTTPIAFGWTTTGGEAININRLAGNGYINVDLDPDGNGLVPDSVTINVDYSSGVHVRYNQNDPTIHPGFAGGAFGVNITTNNVLMDVTMHSADFNGNAISLDGSYDYTTYGSLSAAPSSFSSGGAVWDNVNTGPDTHWQDNSFIGLSNGGLNQSTYFPWVTSAAMADASKALGSQIFTFSDFDVSNGTTEFRLSLDGGVSPDAVPEPSSIGFIILSAFSLTLVRRR